jgi:hypothetical protein
MFAASSGIVLAFRLGAHGQRLALAPTGSGRSIGCCVVSKIARLAEVRAGQALAPPLSHGLWPELALLEMEALLALGRHRDAAVIVGRTTELLASVGFDPRTKIC